MDTETTGEPTVYNEAIQKEIEHIVLATVRNADINRRKGLKKLLEKRAARWTSWMWSRTPAKLRTRNLLTKTNITPLQMADKNSFVGMKRLLNEKCY